MTDTEIVSLIIEAVWNDINDRRGLRHEIDSFDKDIKEEIKDSWRESVVNIMSRRKLAHSAARVEWISSMVTLGPEDIIKETKQALIDVLDLVEQTEFEHKIIKALNIIESDI